MQAIQKHTNLLTEVERKAFEQIPSGLQKFVKAKFSPLISEMDAAEADKMIFDLICQTQIHIGHTKSAEDMEMNLICSRAILSLIKSKYQNLTITELKTAFLNGSIGEYGQSIGVNLKSASEWIKGYLNDEKRKQTMAQWNKCLDHVKKRDYSEEEKEQIEVDGCLHYFNEFKNNKMLERFVMPTDYLCSIFYLRLKKNGLIKDGTFSAEKRQQMYAEAKTEYENSFNNTNISKDIYGAMIQMIAKKQNKPFDHLCKRIALHEYFKELIKNGVDLEEEFKRFKK